MRDPRPGMWAARGIDREADAGRRGARDHTGTGIITRLFFPRISRSPSSCFPSLSLSTLFLSLPLSFFSSCSPQPSLFSCCLLPFLFWLCPLIWVAVSISIGRLPLELLNQLLSQSLLRSPKLRLVTCPSLLRGWPAEGVPLAAVAIPTLLPHLVSRTLTTLP